MEWDLAWAPGDLVFNPSTDMSSYGPCLEPQFAYLIDGIILSNLSVQWGIKGTEGPWWGEVCSLRW